MNKFYHTLTGVTGIGAVELVQSTPLPDLSQGSSLVSTVVQIIIGIVTLIGLLRKKRV